MRFFLRGGVLQVIPKSFLFFRDLFYRAGWKVNGIQEFSGQGTLESQSFGILGPSHVHAS